MLLTLRFLLPNILLVKYKESGLIMSEAIYLIVKTINSKGAEFTNELTVDEKRNLIFSKRTEFLGLTVLIDPATGVEELLHCSTGPAYIFAKDPDIGYYFWDGLQMSKTLWEQKLQEAEKKRVADCQNENQLGIGLVLAGLVTAGFVGAVSGKNDFKSNIESKVSVEQTQPSRAR